MTVEKVREELFKNSENIKNLQKNLFQKLKIFWE